MAEKDNKLVLNNNILTGELRDNRCYLLEKQNEKYNVYFIKPSFMKLIKDVVGNKEYEMNDDIKLLIETKVLHKQSEQSSLTLLSKYCNSKDLDYLNYISLKTRTPYMCKIELTYKCNYACQYCYIKNLKDRMLGLLEIKTIVSKLKRNGVVHLFITGGEPFLHPEINEIIRYCDSLGFILTIQTNGSLINEELAKFLSAFYHLNLAISFHSSIPEKFDAFTQRNGSFDITIDALKILKEYKINHFLKYTVTSDNEEDTKANIAFLESNNINYQVFCQILPDVNDSASNEKFSVKQSTLDWLYKNNHIKFQKSECSALKNKLWIGSNGDVYPCELYRVKLGNLVDNTFDMIWNNGEDLVLDSGLFDIPKKCTDCRYTKYCNKCLAYLKYPNWKSGLDLFCKNTKVIFDKYNMESVV